MTDYQVSDAYTDEHLRAEIANPNHHTDVVQAKQALLTVPADWRISIVGAATTATRTSDPINPLVQIITGNFDEAVKRLVKAFHHGFRPPRMETPR